MSLPKPFFKLICGASLLDPSEIERLSFVYASAGAHLIDVAAHPDAVRAARRGIERTPFRPIVMVSVGVEDDPHLLKVSKDPAACHHCGHCIRVCPHGAWQFPERCCGCGKCLDHPACRALSLVRKEWATDLEACWEAGARGLELHTGSGQGLESWERVCQAWAERGGVFSCSVNGRQLTSDAAISVAHDVRNWFPHSILVQTDGNPISGEEGISSTLPALSFAEAILQSGLDAWIQPAGGANDQTAMLASNRKLPIAGIGMGSFARNRVRGLPEESMVTEAHRLVRSVLLLDGLFQEGAQQEAAAQ